MLSEGLDDDDLFPVIWSFYPEGLSKLVFLVEWVSFSFFPWSSDEAVIGRWFEHLIVGSVGCGGCQWLIVDLCHCWRDEALLLHWPGVLVRGHKLFFSAGAGLGAGSYTVTVGFRAGVAVLVGWL